jgi:hypothetical protein
MCRTGKRVERAIAPPIARAAKTLNGSTWRGLRADRGARAEHLAHALRFHVRVAVIATRRDRI